MAARIGAGPQPRGRTLPQILPDFLCAEAHLEVVVKVTHLTARRQVLFAPVQYALCYQTHDPLKLVQQRAKMVWAWKTLKTITVFEAHRLCPCAPVPT